MVGMRPPRMILLLCRFAVSAALATALSACGSGSSPAVAAGPNHVLVANFAFSPSSLSVRVGDSVTWDFDQPDAPHNVANGAGSDQFASGAPQAHGHFTYRFTQVGTVHYVCVVHPSMRGSVIVTP